MALSNGEKARQIFELILQRIDPTNLSLSSDVFGLLEAYELVDDYRGAAAVVQRYRGVFGSMASQLLGYYWLWDPQHLDDAIREDQLFLQENPGHDPTLFNLACAHAQKFASSGAPESGEASLTALHQAVDRDGNWKKRARQLSADSDGDFFVLSNDTRLGQRFWELTR